MVSDEEEWHDVSPSSRPRVISPVLQPKLEKLTKEPTKAVEIGTTDEHQAVEQDEIKLTHQTTQLALVEKRVQSPQEVQRRVASIEDASSEMTAMASGPRPVEPLASSAVNHRGVTSLSPVSPKRVWMAGTSPSNQGDAASTGEPVKASTIEVPSTPDELAKRENQINQLMAAMEESRAREERMTQMLYDMQQRLNASETQQ